MKMHENELEIKEALVSKLLEEQFPSLSKMSLGALMSNGTDNALFKLGNDYVIRMPRIDWASASVTKEHEWLPKIAKFLTTPISVAEFKGKPSADYPWRWTIMKWNEGKNPVFEDEDEYGHLAKDLAVFLNQLHSIKLPGGPVSRRGVPLKELDMETRDSIYKLGGEINVKSLTSLWTKLSNTPAFDKKPVWVHGDFLPGNILVQNNRLTAVIDFSDVGMGDPACDLIIAWSLFNKSSRQIFKESLDHIDDNMWERGKGLALSIAIIMLPYYKNSNPVLAKLARQIIENILAAEAKDQQQVKEK